VLKWLRANGCPWDKRTCECAAKGGHLEALRWARANGCPMDGKTREYAAQQRGYVEDDGRYTYVENEWFEDSLGW